MEWIEDIPALPPRPDGGHKGTFGTVVVVGGSTLMIGAPALCATAALRSGAGLVKVAGDPAWLPTVIAIQPSATAVDRGQGNEWLGDEKAVLAVGPGLGMAAASGEVVASALASQRPVVLDADGLNHYANNVAARGEAEAKRASGAPWVLTPHPGEFRRLAEALGIDSDPTDPAQRPAAAAGLAQKAGAVVVLKGRHSIVTDGQRIVRNLTGNPALSTAGTGDVLTGLIAGLMAQGAEPFDAAVLGVYLHGDAADHWAKTHGRRGLLAMDLAHALPDAMQRRAAG